MRPCTTITAVLAVALVSGASAAPVNSSAAVSPMMNTTHGNLAIIPEGIETEGYTATQRHVILDIIVLAKIWVDDILKAERGECLTGGDNHNITIPDQQILRKRYFGNVTEEDSKYVTGVYERMQKHWSTTPFICTPDAPPEDPESERCGVGVLGWTNMNTSFPGINLCPATTKGFGVLPFEQLSTRTTLTLVHEMTHTQPVGYPYRILDVPKAFNSSAESGAYGFAKPQQLARWSPSAAIFNAENYGLYALKLQALKYKGLMAEADHARDPPPELEEYGQRYPWDIFADWIRNGSFQGEKGFNESTWSQRGTNEVRIRS